jgi:hypothetical protein
MDEQGEFGLGPTESGVLLRVNRQALYETIRLQRQMQVLVEAVRRLERKQSIDPSAAAVSITNAEAILGCSRSRVFQLIRQGKLQRAGSIGRKAMVTRASVEALQAMNLPQAKPQRAPKMNLAQELEFLRQQRDVRRGRRRAPA